MSVRLTAEGLARLSEQARAETAATGSRRTKSDIVADAVEAYCAARSRPPLRVSGSPLRAETFVDLFCGAGGLSAGWDAASLRCVGAFDAWPDAVDVLRRNLSIPTERICLSDPRTVVALLEGLRPWCLVAGPPCQDHSQAGPRVEGDRADMAVRLAEAVVRAQRRPRWIVLENVPRAEASIAFGRVRTLLQSADYGVAVQTLDASLCGVPQKRKRVFLFAHHGGDAGQAARIALARQSPERLSVRDACWPRISVQHYYRHPRTYDRRAVFSIDEPAPTIRGTWRPPAPGYLLAGRDAQLIARLPNLRTLSLHERSLVQTFPEGWSWGEGPRGAVDQMLGNAVPPALARFVAEAVLLASGRIVDAPAG